MVKVATLMAQYFGDSLRLERKEKALKMLGVALSVIQSQITMETCSGTGRTTLVGKRF